MHLQENYHVSTGKTTCIYMKNYLYLQEKLYVSTGKTTCIFRKNYLYLQKKLPVSTEKKLPVSTGKTTCIYRKKIWFERQFDDCFLIFTIFKCSGVCTVQIISAYVHFMCCLCIYVQLMYCLFTCFFLVLTAVAPLPTG